MPCPFARYHAPAPDAFKPDPAHDFELGYRS